jgi:hypothetical protein
MVGDSAILLCLYKVPVNSERPFVSCKIRANFRGGGGQNRAAVVEWPIDIRLSRHVASLGRLSHVAMTKRWELASF